MAKTVVPGGEGDPIGLRIDVSSIDRLGKLIEQAAKQVPQAVASALNRTADETRTAMKRALQHQTGAPSSVVLRALRVSPASKYFLSSAIVATGSYMSLKLFKPTQNRRGVTASPWGRRQSFPHAFIAKTLGGHVFVRKSKKRLPIHMLVGPAIPVEMGRPKSESVATFFMTVPRVLEKRLNHELGRVIAAATPPTA
jgi:hypothetical protein